MIVALAGRRIDAADASPERFPLANLGLVERRLRGLFESETARGLVSSAACGADLLALSLAGTLGMRRRVILPFDRARFRQTSVTDRPGDWGATYDRVLDELDATHDVIILTGGETEAAAYAAANRLILDEAAALARALGDEPVAAQVWEGESRGDDDLTAAFGREAITRGWRVAEVRTSRL